MGYHPWGRKESDVTERLTLGHATGPSKAGIAQQDGFPQPLSMRPDVLRHKPGGQGS